jgi:DNA-binding transcriptional ArsR family regulator
VSTRVRPISASEEQLPQLEQDTCELFCYDPERVEQLKKALKGTEGISLLFKALADDTRVRIALALTQSELCVCDVAHLMGISVATASHHLRILRNMRLAKYRKEGKLVFYSLDDGHVVTLIEQAMAHYKEALPS